MSDQGLSIFDDNEPEEDETRTAEDDATQVMPAVPPRAERSTHLRDPGRRPAAARLRPRRPRRWSRPAPSRRPPPRPSPAPARPGPAGRPTGPGSLPVVRRGGYDREAVDARIRQLSSEKAGLGNSLTESERRALDLEQQVGRAPGRARRAPDPVVRRPGWPRLRDAAAGRGGGGRGPRERRARRRRDPRAGRARRQGDPRRRRTRGRGHADGPAQGARREPQPPDGRRRAGALAGPQRGRGPGRGRQARGRPAPAGLRAGDQRAAHRRQARGRAAACQRRPRGPGGPAYAGRGEGAARP